MIRQVGLSISAEVKFGSGRVAGGGGAFLGFLRRHWINTHVIKVFKQGDL